MTALDTPEEKQLTDDHYHPEEELMKEARPPYERTTIEFEEHFMDIGVQLTRRINHRSNGLGGKATHRSMNFPVISGLKRLRSFY